MSSGRARRLRGELTEFVGRRVELARVRQALGEARLVLLTGPGAGKTRLARHATFGAVRAFGMVTAAKLRLRSAQRIRGE